MPLVILNEIDDEGGTPKVVCRLSIDEGCSFAEFRNVLNEDNMFDYEFDFWDNVVSSRMKPNVERRNKLREYDYLATVVRSNPSCQRVRPIPVVLPSLDNLGNQGLSSNGSNLASTGSLHPSPSISFDECSQEPSLSITEVQPIPSLSLPEEQPSPSLSPSDVLPVPPTTIVSDAEPLRIQLDSIHIDPDLKKHFMKSAQKLEEQLSVLKMEGHQWRVRAWDQGDNVIARIECLECDVSYSAFSKGKPDKASISNCVTNFKTAHLKSARHHLNWSKKRKLPLEEDEILSRAKRAKLSDRQEVDLALKIMDRVNSEQPGEIETFFRLGDLDREPFHAFYFRVKCSFCGDIMQLVPQQRNLEHNLNLHCSGDKHQRLVQQSRDKEGQSALLSGRPGRPSSLDKRDTRQKTIHTFFGSDQGRSSSSSSRPGTSDLVLDMSVLCWGLWRHFIKWNGYDRAVKSILDDQNFGVEWYAEAHVKADVVDMHSGEMQEIRGLFRHKLCSRISSLGGGFIDLTCEHCNNIKLQSDFRLRVLREQLAVEKRGERGTGQGRRLDYLTNSELKIQSRALTRSIAIERRKVRRLNSRVCLLQSKCPSLREVIGDAATRGDMLKFCNAVVIAHRRGAFGGKSALWDLLKDIVLNLNRKPQGKRYSKGSKVIMQALFHHGGRQVVDCLSMNMLGPSLNTLQRDRRGFLYFRPGFQESQFILVAHVLSNLKKKIGIVGDLPCIIAEDETSVKRSVRWMPKIDSLVGFCGAKENHECESGLEISVGIGEAGFNKIVNAFENHCIGNHARVLMVNPLHVSFPRLCIMATSVCNRFDALWVRQQWDQLESMWDQFVRNLVGPIIGHASDGDMRRRKLMLEDYSDKRDSGSPRYTLGWEGWFFTHSICQRPGQSLVDMHGLHDQDFIHNGKKLEGPLDSCKRTLKLGAFLAMHEHRIQVHNCMDHSEHGLNADDLAKTDRQNWSSAQRLCSRKVISCLKSLRLRKDARVELCQGTEAYLTICADYIDIFLNVRLTLRERVVLCGKVSFFLRIWRLWLEKGNHYVGGNTQPLTLENMVPLQTFLDIQMSCHFVVGLIVGFRDNYPTIPVPLHITGSDSCEQFFSKVGGMKGHERNYDFCELIEAATSLNRLAQLDQHEGIVSVGESHKKYKNIWMKIHPLLDGDQKADLADYSSVGTNILVVDALKEGLLCAQNLCVGLQMCPSTSAANKTWFEIPWMVEKSGVSKDCLSLLQQAEIDNPAMEKATTLQPMNERPNTHEVQVSNDFDIDDEVDDVAFMDGEMRHCMSELVVDLVEAAPIDLGQPKCTDPVVSFEGKRIYKSTLVSQLVGNPTLSKDRLTKVRQSLYFNNLIDKPKERESCPTRLLLSGCDCGVFFEEELVVPQTRSCAPKSKGRKKGKCFNTASSSSPSLPPFKKTWYIGRVQKIRKKYNGKWGRVREPIDLLDRLNGRDGESSIVEVLCNWYTPTSTRLKFKYDSVDGQWINLDAVVSLVSLSINPSRPSIFLLDSHDAKCLDDFVAGID